MSNLRENQIYGPFRLAYLNVFTPRGSKVNPEKPKEYSVMLMIPKEPTAQCPDPAAELAALRASVMECVREKFGDKAKGVKNPIKDGDLETNIDGSPKYPGYWFLNTSCREGYPPILIDGDQCKVTTEGLWVSGDWGKVKVKFWAYDTAANKGVSAGLRAIQFLYKDTPLGSSYDHESAANEFGRVENADKPTYTANSDDYDPFADE